MKDLRVEQWLKREGVEWHWEKAVPLTKIDWGASLKNQARLGQVLKTEHVDELAIAVLTGSELPDPVGYYSKEGNIVIISGNHRIACYKQINELKLGSITAVDFYIVTTFPWKIDVLTRTANALEGLPLTNDEKLEQCKYLVKALGLTSTDASRMLAVPKSTIAHALESDEVRERLARLNFTDKVSSSVLNRLYRIKQDKALLAMAKLVKEAALNSEEAAEVARKVENAAISEKQQTKVIEQITQQYKDRIARTRRGELKKQIMPSVRLRRALNAINLIRPESVVPLEPELARRLKWAVKKLGEILENEQAP